MGRKREKAEQRKAYKESFKGNKYDHSSQPAVKINKATPILGKERVQAGKK